MEVFHDDDDRDLSNPPRWVPPLLVAILCAPFLVGLWLIFG